MNSTQHDGDFRRKETTSLSVIVTYPRRRRPVCIIPWKKRQSTLTRSSKKKKQAAKPPVGPKPTFPEHGTLHSYYTSKVDCVTSTLERTKQPVGTVKLTNKPTRPKLQHSQSTKAHPAMFYSYFVSKGYQYRKACAPKRRSCDGVFGCHDDHASGGKCKGKSKGKKAEKKK